MRAALVMMLAVMLGGCTGSANELHSFWNTESHMFPEKTENEKFFCSYYNRCGGGSKSGGFYGAGTVEPSGGGFYNSSTDTDDDE